MSDSSSKRMQVGIFVIMGIVLFTVAVFVLGGNRAFFVQYTVIKARFDNVVGLNVGSVVSLSGVPVGNVSDIQFVASQNKLMVDLHIESSFLPRITEGSYVEIRTQGALGDKFVYIIPGDPQKPAMKGDIVLDAQSGGDFLGMMSERSGEVGKVFDTVNETHKLIKSINDGDRINKILENLMATSKELNQAAIETRALLNEVSPKIKDSSDRMDRIMKKIDSGQGTLGALINDPSLHEQLKSFVGGNTQKKNIKSLLRNSVEKTPANPE